MCIEHLAIRAPVAQELMFPLAQSMEKNYSTVGLLKIHMEQKSIWILSPNFPPNFPGGTKFSNI